MQESLDITPEAVNQAAEAMITAKPAYRELINFYGRIFAAQEDARQRIRLEPVVIPEELLTIRRREQLPLVPVSGMAFDPAAAGVLLGEICGIAVDCGSGLSSSARILSAKRAEITPLFRDFINEDESAMARSAVGLNVDPHALAFFLYHSLRPALRCCARPAAIRSRISARSAAGSAGGCFTTNPPFAPAGTITAFFTRLPTKMANETSASPMAMPTAT